MNKTLRNITLRFVVVSGLGAISAAAVAHEVPCPFCGMKVVQATKTQDNEVVLRFGKKKIEYRCIFCALADSGKYDGDLVIYAPSETKGQPVLITRTSGKWATVKESDGKLVPDDKVVFINDFSSHAKCAQLSRAFHSKDGFEKYAKANGKAASKALTLNELVAIAIKG